MTRPSVARLCGRLLHRLSPTLAQSIPVWFLASQLLVRIFDRERDSSECEFKFWLPLVIPQLRLATSDIPIDDSQASWIGKLTHKIGLKDYSSMRISVKRKSLDAKNTKKIRRMKIFCLSLSIACETNVRKQTMEILCKYQTRKKNVADTYKWN